MVFSSTLFIFIFLPLTLLGYYILRNHGGNYWLLFASLIFFAWFQLEYLWIIILNILVNFFSAFLIDRFPKNKRAVLISAVIINLAILFYFKYFDFFLNTANNITGSHISVPEIILPIGISFFTFQGMSYVFDVYREDVPVQKNILKLALYIVLFPQLIAGPIIRYKDIEKQINRRSTTVNDFARGAERFITGLAKKAIIANTTALIVDQIWAQGAAGNTALVAWTGSIAYTLQIYFDFSGYSDMAIGLGLMFGFRFMENFNLPYTASDMSEFWRRWHISLSSWFRDYLYIPLGGNKKHVYLNLAIVFLLTGLWHGAAWNFVFWGVWHGFFVIIERLIKRKTNIKPSAPLKILIRIYALLVINTGWVFFRAPDMSSALKYLGVMFGVVTPEHPGFTFLWYIDLWTGLIIIAGILFSTSLPQKLMKVINSRFPEKPLLIIKYAVLLLLFAFSVMQIVSGSYNPFIYFRF